MLNRDRHAEQRHDKLYQRTKTKTKTKDDTKKNTQVQYTYTCIQERERERERKELLEVRAGRGAAGDVSLPPRLSVYRLLYIYI